MDVLLTKDVDRLGKEGTVIHVKPGFARNYLLPQGLAVPAEPRAMKLLEERRRQAQRRVERIRREADQLKRRLETQSVTLKLNVGQDDKPFGSVTAHDLAEALKQENLAVDKSAIQLAEPIKALGIYDVPIRLHPEVTATVKLWIVKA